MLLTFTPTAALGPLLSGFAVPAKDWRWSLYESIWASAPILLAMFVSLPETSTPTILLRRAQRLRKLTGNKRFMSQSEIDQRHMKVSSIVLDALIKPMEITIKDPAVLFVQVYTAIIYAIYYSCKSSPKLGDLSGAGGLILILYSLRSLPPRLPSRLPHEPWRGRPRLPLYTRWLHHRHHHVL